MSLIINIALMITVRQAAEKVKKRFQLDEMKVSTVRQWIKKGKLKATRIVGKFYIDEDHLEAFLSENTEELNQTSK